MRNKNEKRKAEQVEKYIDQDPASASELDQATREMVDTLHRSASEIQPRPGFINELAKQLREQETIMSEKETRSFWGSVTRLLLGGAALAAVALFTLYLAGLFSSPEIEPAVSEDDLPPRPLLEAEGGQHFPDAEFQVMIPLGEEEDEVSLYTVQQAALPATIADARALGERFGLQDPTVYETPTDPGRWIVMGASGANISFRTGGAGLEGLYYSGPQPIAADGEPLAEAEAEAAAIAFLEGTGMLPEDYEIGIQPTVSPVRNVRVVPLLEGHPVAGNQIQIEVGVGPDGNVVHARLNPTNFELVGESVPVKSAAQAFDDLVEGSVTSLGYSFESMPLAAGEQSQFFNPPPPDHQPGEEVNLSGWTSVLVPVAEGEPQATLHSRSGGVYYLQGPLMNELLEPDSQQTLAVKGTIVEQLGPQQWAVQVSEIEPQMDAPVQCQTGQIIRDGEVTLQTDEGEHYSLAYPPEGLESGSRAEVCADEFSDEQPVLWLHIAFPPTSEVVMAGGGGGGSSVAVAVEEVQEVDLTRVVSSESGAEEAGEVVPPPKANPGSAGSGGGGFGGVAIDPAQQWDSPYEIGEVVEVTGIVEGVIYLEDGVRTYEITLRRTESVEGQERFFVYPLLGEPQLLEEIAEANRLHVRITGEVIPGPEGRRGSHDQALVVQSFERVDPEETIGVFLGHIEQETVDGEEVAVFTDEASGQRYALDNDLQPESRRIWLAGVVDPERTVGDLPVLQPYESRTGSDVDQAEDADDINFDPAIQVIDREEIGSGGLHGTLIVERVVLGYKVESGTPSPPVPAGEEPVLLEPVWLFYGRTENGSSTFTIEVPAAEQSGGGRQ